MSPLRISRSARPRYGLASIAGMSNIHPSNARRRDLIDKHDIVHLTHLFLSVQSSEAPSLTPLLQVLSTHTYSRGTRNRVTLPRASSRRRSCTTLCGMLQCLDGPSAVYPGVHLHHWRHGSLSPRDAPGPRKGSPARSAASIPPTVFTARRALSRQPCALGEPVLHAFLSGASR